MGADGEDEVRVINLNRKQWEATLNRELMQVKKQKTEGRPSQSASLTAPPRGGQGGFFGFATYLASPCGGWHGVSRDGEGF